MTKDEAKDRIKRYREQIAALENGIDEMVQDLTGHDDVTHILSYWDCAKSPIGLCLYDRGEASFDKHCIYCGQPNERY